MNIHKKLLNNIDSLMVSYENESKISEIAIKYLKVAVEYDKLGQHASAFNSYLRYLDNNYDLSIDYREIIPYAVYIRLGIILETMGNRTLSAKTFYQKAISYRPDRPEAYYFLGRLHERSNNPGHWDGSLMYCMIGIRLIQSSQSHMMGFDEICNTFSIPNAYPGNYGLYFQASVASSWLNQKEFSKKMLQTIKNSPNLSKNIDKLHYEAINRNMKVLGNYKYDPAKVKYNRELCNAFIPQFKDLSKIEENCSEFYQDMFVLSVFSGKHNGTFLEIGSGPYKWNNNTWLLEAYFGWKGVAIDYNSDFVDEYNKMRGTACLNLDAVEDIPLKMSFVDIINEHVSCGFVPCEEPDDNKIYVDYLQIDIDPAHQSLKVLLSIPFDKMEFGVITFEHDSFYTLNESIKTTSRNFLKSQGYILVFGDVGPVEGSNIEDWYIHKSLANNFKQQFGDVLNENVDKLSLTPQDIFFK